MYAIRSYYALRKNILSSGNFAFPIGKTGRIGDIEVSSTSGNDYWVVEYFNQSPVVDNLDPTSYLAPLNFVTLNEYWQVKAESAMTALVKCDWDATSVITSYSIHYTKLYEPIIWFKPTCRLQMPVFESTYLQEQVLMWFIH